MVPSPGPGTGAYGGCRSSNLKVTLSAYASCVRSKPIRFNHEVGSSRCYRRLAEIPNPSAIFLSERLADTVGSAVVPTLEGSRPLLVEVQALTSPSVFGQPRRVANGLDYGRLLMLTAVLGRRCGLKLGKEDVIANATGGMRISEPAADLAIALAIASSYRDRPVLPDLTAVGEVGLSGEIRAVPRLDRRLAEAARLGFKACLVPERSAKNTKNSNIRLIAVSTLREAIRMGLREVGA